MKKLAEELQDARMNQANAAADEKLRDEILQLNNKIQEMKDNFLVEKQRNMQLRLKSG